MIYRATIGSSVTLVDAASEHDARRFIGTKLGYAHKPYLWERIELAQPTAEQLKRDRALGLKVVRSEIKDASKGRDG